jgi:hypothetical protein
MTTDAFCFYLQKRLIQTGQTGGQLYSDTPPATIPWFPGPLQPFKANSNKCLTIGQDRRWLQWSNGLAFSYPECR